MLCHDGFHKENNILQCLPKENNNIDLPTAAHFICHQIFTERNKLGSFLSVNVAASVDVNITAMSVHTNQLLCDHQMLDAPWSKESFLSSSSSSCFTIVLYSQAETRKGFRAAKRGLFSRQRRCFGAVCSLVERTLSL